MTAKVTFNTERCKCCELCVSVCPKHIVAIDTAVTNRKGYHPAHVTDITQCIACASCVPFPPLGWVVAIVLAFTMIPVDLIRKAVTKQESHDLIGQSK